MDQPQLLLTIHSHGGLFGTVTDWFRIIQVIQKPFFSFVIMDVISYDSYDMIGMLVSDVLK